MTNWLQAVGRLIRRDRVQTTWEWSDRQDSYLLWDAYYNNTVYDALTDGGQRESINIALGNASAADLTGLYNPVANVVDLYLHVFAGAFGDEITIEPRGNGGAKLMAAVDDIWRWSNLTIEKQPLCRLAATHGNVGLRIVARNDDDKGKRRVYIKPEHPRVIKDLRMDDRGNIEQVLLEYDIEAGGLAEEAKTICIRELMTKETISTWRVEGAREIPYDMAAKIDNGPQSVKENVLGVVPYVLLRHEHNGEKWGRNAFYKARNPIDRLNALMTHIDVQIHRHVKVKWLIAASGAAPVEIDLTDMTVAYVDLRDNSPPPMMQPMVANLNLSDSTNQSRLQLEVIEDLLPELKATQGRYLSGQSGETVVELRKPAEDKLSTARDNYEDALIRAQQIAVSWGILLELWDVGTGMGSKEAADNAYHQGYEDMRFNKRPLLPSTQTAQSGTTAIQPAQQAPTRERGAVLTTVEEHPNG